MGYESARLFAEKGWQVTTVDNYMRAKLFGEEGNTRPNINDLTHQYGVQHHEIDLRDEKIAQLVKNTDVVIHAAAQPSHPKSIEIPMDDFQINAYGTLFLLENVRKYNRDAIFVFCSTNKVYGDTPNYFSYRKVQKRFEPVDPLLQDGFDETLRVDRCMHTPFGVSKVAADLYAQDYAALYGLKTGVFRMGCITGGAAKAVELHNWEPYFVKKALTGEKLTLYGHQGYQVRDVIHARDLASLFYEFVIHPRPGEVYNVGGGRDNSVSLLEAIELVEEITGKTLTYSYGQEREGDHIWWISNLNKVKHHYPKWRLQNNLQAIFTEIYEDLTTTVRHRG